MGVWKWEGFDKTGKKTKGQISAQNEKDARKKLRANGNRVRTLIAPSVLEFDIGEWLLDKGLAVPFGNKELVIFTKQYLKSNKSYLETSSQLRFADCKSS